MEMNQEFPLISSSEIELNYKENKKMYAHALSIVENFLGKPSYPYLTQQHQLYPYILSLSDNLKDEEYKVIKDEIPKTEMKIQLHVTIKTAKISHPKYNSFSNVNCKLWVEPGKQQVTTAKDSDSNLLWNETFVLKVPNYESDNLHLELWSSHPAVKKGQKNISKENVPCNRPRNYFIGDVVQAIKCLPCNGQDFVWTLRKGTQRLYTKGKIQVFVQLFAHEKKNHPFHICIHLALLLLCYEKQLEKFQGFKLCRNWLEILPNAAVTLIQQHAIQHGITSTEQILCSWLVASSLKIRKEDRISFYFLEFLLEALLINIDENSLESYLEETLCNSIYSFFEYTLDMLQKLHNFEAIHCDLFCMLKCISVIYAKMETYCQKTDLNKTVEEEGYQWYLRVISDYKEDLKEDDCFVEKVCDTLNEIVKCYMRNQIKFDDIFIRAWSMSYTKITLKKLDDVIYNILRPIIWHLRIIIGDPERKRQVTESFKILQLYHSIRNLVHYVLTRCASERIDFYMEGYASWFGGDIILEWFLLCDIYTQPFIKKAVFADSMDQINSNILHSASIPDVILIIDEMVIDIWMKLKWHDQFYTHGALIEALRSCIIEYIQAVSEKIKEKNFFPESHQFKISKKVCVVLSNAYALFKYIHIIKKKIEDVLKAAESEYGFTVVDPLMAVESQLLISTSAIYLLILKQVNKRLRKFIKQMKKVTIDNTFHPNITDELCTYIEYILEMLYLNLKSEPFYILLRYMWIIVLENLQEGLKHKGFAALWRRKKNIFIITSQALNQLEIIFYCDGHGLSYEQLQNETYVKLKQRIKIK